jgi:hypothetical protein
MTSFFIHSLQKFIVLEAVRRLLCLAENSYQGPTPSDKKSSWISSNFHTGRKLMRLIRRDSWVFVAFAQHSHAELSESTATHPNN